MIYNSGLLTRTHIDPLSKGGPLSTLAHTHFFLTRSTIGKGDTRSWNRPSRTLPPQSTQPCNKAKSDDKDRDTINDFTESKADQGSGPIDNDGGSESVYSDTDSIVEEVKPVKRNLQKRTTCVYISNSEDDFEQCDFDDAKVLTPDSLSCNNTNTKQEDIEVFAMFNSMVSVSE
ncbi:hypothetical protein PM082_019999 [Marasmius tenuissimus]|nr:hypothetical protein PM082_019999 [Marasmius tenuissimus]